MWLCGWWLHVISYHPVRFSFNKACEIRDKTFLVRHVITHGNMIKGSSYFVSGDSSLQAITLLNLVAIGFVEVKMYRSSFVTWTQVTTWSKEYVVFWLDIWLLIISHNFVKFDSDRSRESEFITSFTCRVTLYDHVINRLRALMDNSLALEPTTRSSLLAIGPMEVEI